MKRHVGNYARRAAHRSPRQAWAVLDDYNEVVLYAYGPRDLAAVRAEASTGCDPAEFDACFPRAPRFDDELRAGVTFACDGCDHNINNEDCDCQRCDKDPDTIGPPVQRAGNLYCGAPCARENEV